MEIIFNIFIWFILFVLFIALLRLLIQKRNLYVYKIYDNNLKRITLYRIYDLKSKSPKYNKEKYKNINLHICAMYKYKFAVFNLFLWHPDKFIKKWFRKDLLKFEKDNK